MDPNIFSLTCFTTVRSHVLLGGEEINILTIEGNMYYCMHIFRLLEVAVLYALECLRTSDRKM
jgi:hypothetical protein